MNIKVAAFTVSEKSTNISLLDYQFILQLHLNQFFVPTIYLFFRQFDIKHSGHVIWSDPYDTQGDSHIVIVKVSLKTISSLVKIRSNCQPFYTLDGKFRNFLCFSSFCVHHCAILNNFNCNDENRILGN